jgi:hypothetical protein
VPPCARCGAETRAAGEGRRRRVYRGVFDGGVRGVLDGGVFDGGVFDGGVFDGGVCGLFDGGVCGLFDGGVCGLFDGCVCGLFDVGVGGVVEGGVLSSGIRRLLYRGVFAWRDGRLRTVVAAGRKQQRCRQRRTELQRLHGSVPAH